MAAWMFAPGLAAPANATPTPMARFRDLEPAAASTTVRIVLQLAPRHGRELGALIADQSDSSSPLYRRFLSRIQFAQYFSPTPAEYARVCALLRRAGFAIEQTFGLRLAVDASAPAPVVESYFRTRLERVEQPGVGARYVNTRAVTIPQELRAVVEGVDGFNTLVVSKSTARAALRGRASPFEIAPSSTAPILTGPDGGFSPIALSLAYDLPAEYGATGAGYKVADIIDGSVTDGYVATYLSAFGLTRSGPATQLVAVDGGCGTRCIDNAVADFDAESVLGQAIGAVLYTYQLPGLDNKSIEDGFAQAVSDDTADVVVTSFGACETLVAPQGQLVDASQKAGTAMGMTFISVGAGQLGSAGAFACGPSAPPAVQAPEAGQYDLGVGGTDVVTDSQTGVFERQRGDNDSGGGISKLTPLPFYQDRVVRLTTSGRNLPDLSSAAAIDRKGPSWFSNGWVGGYPFPSAAPIAGVMATFDQMDASRLGLVNVRLYNLFVHRRQHHGGRLFRDVLYGCNGLTPRTPPYCAGAGYDLVTGMGSPDGENLAHNI